VARLKILLRTHLKRLLSGGSCLFVPKSPIFCRLGIISNLLMYFDITYNMKKYLPADSEDEYIAGRFDVISAEECSPDGKTTSCYRN